MFRVEEAVRRYYRTVDTAGPEATVALFTEDSVYRRPGYDVIRGRQALARFYGGERVIAEGQHTIQEVVIEGDRAAIRGSFQGLLRDGAEVEVDFADFLNFEGDLIAARTTYFYKPAV